MTLHYDDIPVVTGQNVLEPAALGKPVVVGPHMDNFREITERFLSEGALVQVRSAEELGRVFVDFFVQGLEAGSGTLTSGSRSGPM